MRYLYFILALFVSEHLAAQKPKLPIEVRQSIEKRIAYGMNPSLVVGIVNDKGTSYFSFGTHRENGPKATEHSVYEIGSISKTFTATLLADQVLKGQMKTEDPVQQYLPSSVTMPVYDQEQITLGHLSDHTSSLPRLPSNLDPQDPSNPYADYTVEQMYAFLNSCKLERAVGSQYEYSNLAPGLLGHVLELHTRTTYEDQIQQVILDPLGMSSTRITLDDNMKNKLAIGHSNGDEISNWDFPTLAGAGAIRSTLHDMVSYVKANLEENETVLSKAIRLTHIPRHGKAAGSRVGLGWHISPVNNVEVFHHGGATGGYRAFAGFRPDLSVGVVVMTNADTDIEDIGLHLLVPESPLREIRPSISFRFREIFDQIAADQWLTKMEEAKNEKKYTLDENSINLLGYSYLRRGETKKAEAVFEFNVKTYPASSNVYDSYAESLMEGGQNALAIFYYKKSLEINPGNTNGIDMLAKLGVTYAAPQINIDEKTLESYTGVYELAPGYTITIARSGTQLTGQVTGQQAFEIFPSAATEFYFKIVPATIVFNMENGKVTSLTLSQNGQVYTCRKL